MIYKHPPWLIGEKRMAQYESTGKREEDWYGQVVVNPLIFLLFKKSLLNQLQFVIRQLQFR